MILVLASNIRKQSEIKDTISNGISTNQETTNNTEKSEYTETEANGYIITNQEAYWVKTKYNEKPKFEQELFPNSNISFTESQFMQKFNRSINTGNTNNTDEVVNSIKEMLTGIVECMPGEYVQRSSVNTLVKDGKIQYDGIIELNSSYDEAYVDLKCASAINSDNIAHPVLTWEFQGDCKKRFNRFLTNISKWSIENLGSDITLNGSFSETTIKAITESTACECEFLDKDNGIILRYNVEADNDHDKPHQWYAGITISHIEDDSVLNKSV